jgi:hypothetical protein
MYQKNKVETESGGTWHHPRAIEAWLNNGKSSRSCNRDNLVKAMYISPYNNLDEVLHISEDIRAS